MAIKVGALHYFQISCLIFVVTWKMKGCFVVLVMLLLSARLVFLNWQEPWGFRYALLMSARLVFLNSVLL